jgi:hypothetical protein
MTAQNESMDSMFTKLQVISGVNQIQEKGDFKLDEIKESKNEDMESEMYDTIEVDGVKKPLDDVDKI